MPFETRTHSKLIVAGERSVYRVGGCADSTRAAGAGLAAAKLSLRNCWAEARADDADSLRDFVTTRGGVRANEIFIAMTRCSSSPLAPISRREAPAGFSIVARKRHARARGKGSRVTGREASRASWMRDDEDLLCSGGWRWCGDGLVLVVIAGAAPCTVIAEGAAACDKCLNTLPILRGYESGIIGTAFNDMASAVQEKVAAERHAREAEASLEERREFAKLVEQRLDEERRMIARELHDEFAQSVTAIRTLAVAISTQVPDDKSPTHEAARVISAEAGRLYMRCTD